jgi:hypothetical protein
MLLDKLLNHFDAYTTLHIDVNDVRDQLLELGVQDEIKFHFVKMDHSKIRGLLHRYTKTVVPYGEPIFCSDILIPIEMGEEEESWQRLVAVKELLHITDSSELSAQSEEAVNNLFEQFSLPPELREPVGTTALLKKSFLNDRVRIYAALAVLIPVGCRELLRPLFKEKLLSAREIAEIAKVPMRYIPIVMDNDFEEFIAALLGWEKSEEI